MTREMIMLEKKKVKALIVDDEPSITKTVARILTRAGYEAIEINDPVKVEEYLLYTSLGIVITDYQMPGLNGLQVLELIKGSNPDLPVLFLTGQGTIETAVEATKGGAVVFLTKPFDPDELVKAVKNHARVDDALPDDVRKSLADPSFDQEALAAKPDHILLEDEIVSTDTIPEGLVEVNFADILPGQLLPFSLYLQIYNRKSRRHLLRKICPENTVFTTGLKEILEKRSLGSAFVREQDYGAFLEYYRAVKSASYFQHQKIRDNKRLLLYGKAVEAISEILNDPNDNRNIKKSVDLVDELFQTLVNDPVTYQDMFKLFKRDTSIFNHSANVCLLCVSFGIHLGLDQKKIQMLGLGGLFHDVGMNRLDRKILEKKTPLTPLEWEEIRKHPERGMVLLKASNIIPIQSLRIILEHHEREDGSGYPRGLKGNQISRLATLCRIVDKFDTMTTEKPYRPAFRASEALKRIFLEESNPGMQNIIKKFIAFLGGK